MTKKKEVKMYRHYGAIDIGSNAVRLLIKRLEKTDGKVIGYKELMLRVPLRLGFDVFKRNKISKDNARKLSMLIKSFSYLMKIYEVNEYMACATSAIRDARNGKKIIKSIKERTGIHIHIINGKQEAKGIYKNYTDCVDTSKGNYMYVDVGGGSTEISMLSDGHLVSTNSYDIGTIRILCNTVEENEWKRMEEDVRSIAERYTGINIIGSGGNINKLYRLIENRDKKRQRISVKSLSDICDLMADMSVEERVVKLGLKYDRADVIVPAGTIFLSISEQAKAKYIYVPTIGLADGMINILLENDSNKYKVNKDDEEKEDDDKCDGVDAGVQEDEKDEELPTVNDEMETVETDSSEEDEETPDEEEVTEEK